MQPLTDAFQAFAQSAAPAAVTSLWQGLAVAAALAIGLRLAPRISAAHRFLICSTSFAVVAALPFLPALAAHPVAHFAAQVASPTPSALFVFSPRWMQAIAILWLAASLYRAADLAIHALRLRRLWRTAAPVDLNDAPIAAVRNVEVCTTPHFDRPSVIGFFTPRILIPAWLFPRLTPGELNQIVLHESQHLSRRDDWTNLAQKLCLVIFPLNPALLWLDRRLAREREMACDEAVIRITHAPRAYAACLASLAERGLARRTEPLRTEALSLGAFERRPELVHRVHSILRTRRALHPVAARAVFASLACGLAALSFELAQCPQLVAFASVAKPAQAKQIAQSNVADAVYTERPHIAQHFRAIPAKAVMPITSAEPLAYREATRHRVTAAPEHLALSSEELAAKSSVAQPETQQWIVFTAWEQVETTQPLAGTDTRAAVQQPTADYDTTPAADAVAPSNPGDRNPGDRNPGTPAAANATPAAAPTAAQPVTHIRVTQLVLKVLPTASKSHQSAAIPLGNGWFVIQL